MSAVDRRKDILVFDVNETLLDLRALDPVFAELFGDAPARQEWFTILLQRAFTATLTDAYRDFGALARSALKMLAKKHDREISDAQVSRVLAALKELPAHPEVSEALKILSEGGFVLTALTQSPEVTLEAQLENAGLKPFFTRMFSADTVRRYKPAPEPYRMVADNMECETKNLRLIAAHGWDIEGALQAGCKAAFVARAGQVLDPDAAQPDIIGSDLAEVAVEVLGTIGAVKT